MVQRRTKSAERALIGLRPIGKAGEFWPFPAAHDQCIHLRLQGVDHMVQQWLALDHCKSLVAAEAARLSASNQCAEQLHDRFPSAACAVCAIQTPQKKGVSRSSCDRTLTRVKRSEESRVGKECVSTCKSG